MTKSKLKRKQKRNDDVMTTSFAIEEAFKIADLQHSETNHLFTIDTQGTALTTNEITSLKSKSKYPNSILKKRNINSPDENNENLQNNISKSTKTESQKPMSNWRQRQLEKKEKSASWVPSTHEALKIENAKRVLENRQNEVKSNQNDIVDETNPLTPTWIQEIVESVVPRKNSEKGPKQVYKTKRRKFKGELKRDEIEMFPAIMLPTSASSYNPSAEEYSNELKRLDKLKKAYQRWEKNQTKLLKPMKSLYSTKNLTNKTLSDIIAEAELDNNLSDDEDNHEENFEKQISDSKNENKKNENSKGKRTDPDYARTGERKTASQRRKEKRKIMLQRKERIKTGSGSGKGKVSIPQIVKNVEKATKKKQEQKEKAKENRRKRILSRGPTPIVYGKAEIHPPRNDISSPANLSENFRSLKPVGNILKEQFHSLRSRNIIGDISLKASKAKSRRKSKKKVIDVHRKFEMSDIKEW